MLLLHFLCFMSLLSLIFFSVIFISLRAASLDEHYAFLAAHHYVLLP